MAVQVIDSGVKALYADLEPFAGFCNRDCSVLAEHFWYRVRAERPNAHLGVIYDPRPWWWEQSATSKWFSVANSALPMCYWESYVDQSRGTIPAGCVSQAHRDLGVLAPGRHLEYVPMLQGNTTRVTIPAGARRCRGGGASRVERLAARVDATTSGDSSRTTRNSTDRAVRTTSPTAALFGKRRKEPFT